MGKKATGKKQALAEEQAAPPAEEEAPAPSPSSPEDAAGDISPTADPETAEHMMPSLDLETARELAQYDLTSRMIPFLDRHLIFPILKFLQAVGMYKPEDMTRAELQLLSETNMIDAAIDTYVQIGEEVPESLTQRREHVLEQLMSSKDQVLELLKILEDPDQVKTIPNFKTVVEMCNEFQVPPDVVEGLVHYAKLQFDCGMYGLCAEVLKHYRRMPQEGEPTANLVSCTWGSLASALLNNDYLEAAELISTMDKNLEETKAPKREVLIHRAWLLHWTLFAIFAEKPDGEKDKQRMEFFHQEKPKLLDFFLSEKSMSIISLSCPHLFRYVGACLILQKRLKQVVKDTVWIIHHEAASYSDPITRFLLALYTEMDYDEAQRELQRCEMVCRADFFLAKHWAEFQENARLHIFESYCRIHQCINIQMIASKLNMEAEEAELWIVKLIQNAKLDARIDSEKSRVVMTKAPPNVYQQVIEKTKNLAFRSTMLVSNLEKN